jgi:4-amino-4-deoxy-L-arabinose transferase-like glycosyltransferase
MAMAGKFIRIPHKLHPSSDRTRVAENLSITHHTNFEAIEVERSVGDVIASGPVGVPLPMNYAEGVSEPSAGPKKRLLFLLSFATLLILHVAANLWWLAEDRHSIQSDESLHMRYAREYYEMLVLDESKHLGDRFLDVFQKQNTYPPLSHLFAVAAMAVLGYGPDQIALSGTILFVLLLLGVYAVARRCVPPWEALFATTVASFIPLLYGASRNFMTDYASAVFVVWAMYCLIKSNTFRNTGWVFTFALLTGIGMMTRQTTVVFYLVPCFVVVCLALIEALFSKHEDKAPMSRIILNILITLTVSLGIIMPWHLEHVAFLREFWNTHFFGGRGIFDQAFVALGEWRILAYAGIGAASILVLWASIVSIERLRKGSPRLHFLWVILHAMGVVGLLAFLLTNDAWSRLALSLIQNGIFLPIFLLAVVGLLRCIDARYRTQPLFLVALWLLGSYVILSFVFNSRVPRYFVPAAAPLGIFAALAISSLRNNALRWGSGLLLMGLLLFQFANLTFMSWGSFRAPALASVVTHERLGKMAEAPLPIFKDKVIAGNYAFHSAQREDGFADRLLKGMAADLESRRKIYEPIATYQRLTNQSQFEGLWFAERHYWPTPNPFALDEVTAGTKPIKAIGTRWQKQPEDLLGRLDATDFVLIKTEVPDQFDGTILEADVEMGRDDSERWERFFLARDFERVDQFHEQRYNSMPGGIYTLLGRKQREYTTSRRMARLRPSGVSEKQQKNFVLSALNCKRTEGTTTRTPSNRQKCTSTGPRPKMRSPGNGPLRQTAPTPFIAPAKTCGKQTWLAILSGAGLLILSCSASTLPRPIQTP